MPKPTHIAVLCSGNGSNLQSLIDRSLTGELEATIAWVAGNNSRAHGLERARLAGIPAHHVSTATEGSDLQVGERLASLVAEHGIDYLVLAGYMRPIPSILLEALPGRIVNIHPSLLPAFGGKGMFGRHVHQAVVDRGAQWTGVTVHLVSERYDEGPILCQRIVPVHPGDTAETLGARVLQVEHDTLWKAVRALSRGRVRFDGRIARIEGGLG
jgi:phosphoribosylglycinamide formyltransferase-1